MSLTQAMLNSMAAAVAKAFPAKIETLTLHRVVAQGGSATDYEVENCKVEEYTEMEIDAIEILRTDRRFKFPVSGLSVTPTQWSALTRADDTEWQVISATGGSGTPWHVVQGRQIG